MGAQALRSVNPTGAKRARFTQRELKLALLDLPGPT
jgi:hypothetical protein